MVILYAAIDYTHDNHTYTINGGNLHHPSEHPPYIYRVKIGKMVSLHPNPYICTK